MAVVALVLLVATALLAVILQAAMLVKDEPFYGMIGFCVLCGPSLVLTFVYLSLTGPW